MVMGPRSFPSIRSAEKTSGSWPPTSVRIRPEETISPRMLLSRLNQEALVRPKKAIFFTCSLTCASTTG